LLSLSSCASPFYEFVIKFSAPEKIKAMGLLLSKAKEQLYDCKLVTGKLRAMLQSSEEQVRVLKKQSTFLSQLAAKTIPNGIHCLAMKLTIDYYLLPPEKRKFPKQENLENPSLYHYALFSDNVLAASVVLNSAIMHAKVRLQTIPSDALQVLNVLVCLCLCCIGGFVGRDSFWMQAMTSSSGRINASS